MGSSSFFRARTVPLAASMLAAAVIGGASGGIQDQIEVLGGGARLAQSARRGSGINCFD